MPNQNKLNKIKEELKAILSEKVKNSVESIPIEISRDMSEIIIRCQAIKDVFTLSELNEEIIEFLIGPNFVPPKDFDDFIRMVSAFVDDLVIEKDYDAILLFPTLIGLPIGKRIGALEIINKPLDKPELDEHIELLEKGELIYSEGGSWSIIRFKSFKTKRVRDDLFRCLELPFSFLSFIMHVDLDIEQSCGIIYYPNSTIQFLQPTIKSHEWSRYSEEKLGKLMSFFSEITQSRRPNELQKRIIQSMQIFGLSRLSRKTELRFLITIAAIESLLLTKTDRDYLGLKLAEKTAFLLENERERRIVLYKLMKNYYDMRSGIIHRGTSDISKDDEENISGLYRYLINKLIDLSSKYEKMEQKSSDTDEEGIEDYVNDQPPRGLAYAMVAG